jgi:hypothetical protein
LHRVGQSAHAPGQAATCWLVQLGNDGGFVFGVEWEDQEERVVSSITTMAWHAWHGRGSAGQ